MTSVDRLRSMVPSAYLRVFQPLDAFERDEQAAWERYLVEHARLPRQPARYVDRAHDGLGVIVPAQGEHAEVRVVEGRTYLSPWHVPIRWFVLFHDDERWLGEDEHGRLRLRYRTTARRGLRRAGQAIPVLRRSDLGPISELLLDLHEWIGLFDPRGLVELDYGSLCDFLTWD